MRTEFLIISTGPGKWLWRCPDGKTDNVQRAMWIYPCAWEFAENLCKENDWRVARLTITLEGGHAVDR